MAVALDANREFIENWPNGKMTAEKGECLRKRASEKTSDPTTVKKYIIDRS